MRLVIDPAETALLVVDMQNAFCHAEGTLGLGGVDMAPLRATIPHVRRLVRLCRESGIPDIWSRQIHYPRDRAREAHKILPHTLRRPRVACQPGSWDAEIVDELRDLVGPTTEVLDKHKWSCFYGTRLSPLLRILGTRLLIICGTTTNLCVDTTIRDAYMRDYDVVVARDAVAGVDPAWHEASLGVWARYMAEVLSVEELATMIRPAAGARS
jgi:ureidoacrylate peracid hydrolase